MPFIIIRVAGELESRVAAHRTGQTAIRIHSDGQFGVFDERNVHVLGAWDGVHTNST